MGAPCGFGRPPKMASCLRVPYFRLASSESLAQSSPFFLFLTNMYSHHGLTCDCSPNDKLWVNSSRGSTIFARKHLMLDAGILREELGCLWSQPVISPRTTLLRCHNMRFVRVGRGRSQAQMPCRESGRWSWGILFFPVGQARSSCSIQQ